jgi:polyhydroxybutyrate depolymerase
MKRGVAIAAALIVTVGVTIGAAISAGAGIMSEIRHPTTTATYSMKVGHLTRRWEVIAPSAALPRSAPIIVVLTGKAATDKQEIKRDRLVPYVDAGRAELVYPLAIKQSWNAIGCCGAAARLKVNDLAFLEALVPRVDPGRQRPIYFVGYSNGGRMAYRLACADPGLFDGMAAVKADPMPGCVVSKPENILVVSSLDDPSIAYKPGEKGRETPAATVQVARLRSVLACARPPAVAAYRGVMTLTTWPSCADGKRLAWGVWQSGGHNFPPPTAHAPGADQIIWSFFTKTPLAPVPRLLPRSAENPASLLLTELEYPLKQHKYSP